MSEVLFGNVLHKKDLHELDNNKPLIQLKGKNGVGKESVIPFSEGLLGRHIMLIGGIGTGKTNAINHILAELRNAIDED